MGRAIPAPEDNQRTLNDEDLVMRIRALSLAALGAALLSAPLAGCNQPTANADARPIRNVGSESDYIGSYRANGQMFTFEPGGNIYSTEQADKFDGHWALTQDGVNMSFQFMGSEMNYSATKSGKDLLVKHDGHVTLYQAVPAYAGKWELTQPTPPVPHSYWMSITDDGMYTTASNLNGSWQVASDGTLVIQQNSGQIEVHGTLAGNNELHLTAPNGQLVFKRVSAS